MSGDWFQGPSRLSRPTVDDLDREGGLTSPPQPFHGPEYLSTNRDVSTFLLRSFKRKLLRYIKTIQKDE